MSQCKPLAMTALRNRIRALNPQLTVELRNVRVNGVLFGCYGFITNPATGQVIYVCTDHNHMLNWDNALYRTAKNNKDFTGGMNKFARYDDLPRAVVDALSPSLAVGA